MNDLTRGEPERHPSSAGGLLRQARQAQGLHIAALAASIKVTPAKLEALESDRFDLLPDATFTRALAQAVCRVLKIETAPVLALLPPPNGHRLEQVAEGLKTPFRERPGRLAPKEWAKVSGLALGGAALILVAALLVYFVPTSFFQKSLRSAADLRLGAASAASADGPASAGEAATAAGGDDASQGAPRMVQESPDAIAVPEALRGDAPPRAASGVPEAAPPVAMASPATASTPGAAPVGTGELEVGAVQETWVEVVDSANRVLLSRTLRPEERVGVDGSPPFRVRIGNVKGTEMRWRGAPVELKAYSRDNIARFELK